MQTRIGEKLKLLRIKVVDSGQDNLLSIELMVKLPNGKKTVVPRQMHKAAFETMFATELNVMMDRAMVELGECEDEQKSKK